jgi:hypothetical protein
MINLYYIIIVFFLSKNNRSIIIKIIRQTQLEDKYCVRDYSNFSPGSCNNFSTGLFVSLEVFPLKMFFKISFRYQILCHALLLLCP